jgi:hypothetical protein
MKKYVAYDEAELKQKMEFIVGNLSDVSRALVVISQQLDEKRSNLDGNYAKNSYKELQRAVEELNEIYATYQLIPFSEEEKNLEKIMKEDIF